MKTRSAASPGMGQELLADAKGVGSTAVNRLHSEVDNRKGDAVAQAKSVSSAIESAAQGLDKDAPAWLRSAFTQSAQQVRKFADTLEQKDSRQIVNEVSDFARKSPTTFLLACAATGFAASRIFQAGANESSPRQPAAIGTGDKSSTGSTGFAAPKSDGQTTSQFGNDTAGPVGGQYA